MSDKIIDLHGDLFSHFSVAAERGEVDIFKKYHLDNFRKGNIYLSMFNVWIDDENVDVKKRASDILSYGAKEILRNNDILNPVYNYNDINENGKINFIIGLEGIDYLDNANELYMMYQYGARLVSLTWNHSNNFAASITDDNDFGLTKEGKRAIKVINELGIILDISHLSDNAVEKVFELSTSPVIASHSNVRNLASHKRNLKDEFIIKIAKSGGVVGMNSYPLFASDDDDKKNVKGLVDHIDYINDLVGIDCIALGFDFMDYLDDDNTSSFIEGSPYMSDLKNHSYINNLIDELRNRDYSDEEINKISYKNALNVIERVLK